MRVALTFSLRADAVRPIDAVCAELEAALGCVLHRGTFARVPAFVGEVLGIRIGLLPWRGLDGMRTYQLHGEPAWPPPLPSAWEEIRIDVAVLDLLEHRGAEGWRIPSKEELKAEGQYDLDEI